MYSQMNNNYGKTNNRRFTPIIRKLCIINIVLLVIFIAIIVKVFGKSCDDNTVTNNENTQIVSEMTNMDKIPEDSQTINPQSNEETTNVPAPAEETVTTVQTPTQSEQIEEEHPPIFEGDFELPLEGAHVYPSVITDLYDDDGSVSAQLEPGSKLEILAVEGEDQFKVRTTDGKIGHIEYLRCMIDLAEIIPSIVYSNTNSTAAIYQSSGYSIDNVTGEQLYNVKTMNTRFGEEEFVMAMLYSSAKKVMMAQQIALSEGYCLRIYETYRPLETQKQIASGLAALAESNSDVMNGISSDGWSMNWFIATKCSNHQRGYAMDLSLVKVVSTETKTACGYSYMDVTEYEDLEMPTPVHELSKAAATFTGPVNSKDDSSWKSATLASGMTEAAIKLQQICTDAGFTPLASEYWHFNDLQAMVAIGNNVSNGAYYLQVN